MSAKSSTHSNLHSNCRHGPREKKPEPKPILTTKPFCDCKDCACDDCPDILGMLSITVTENSCDFGSKGKKCCKVNLCTDSSEPDISPTTSSILNVMTDRGCSCEIMARTVRSNVHINMGLTDRRETINTSEANQSNRPSRSDQRKPNK